MKEKKQPIDLCGEALLQERAVVAARLAELEKRIVRLRDSAVAAAVQQPYVALAPVLLRRSRSLRG